MIQGGKSLMEKLINKDRKMTNVERVAAEKHYYLLDVYMKKRRLDENEWRSNLHIPFVKGVQKYYEEEKLHKYNITTIIWKKLDNYYSNYCRDMTRKKRKPKGGICSYECLEGVISYSEVSKWELGYTYKILEREIVSKLMLEKVISEVDNIRMQNVVKMLAIGLKKGEVRRIMGLSNYKLMSDIDEIKRVVLEIYGE